MISTLQSAATTALTVCALIHPQFSFASGFDGKIFLTWNADGQDGYINTSVTMASVIASQTKPSVSNCIDQWYFQSDAIRAQRNDEIRQTIRENPTYHPSGVIYAWITKRCGAFK